MSDLPSDANDRRASLTRDIMAETGIDEAMIGRLVRTFYREIRADAILGPIFNTRITNWDAHIEKLCAFWSSVALMSGRYHGHRCKPMSRFRCSGRISIAGSTCSNVRQSRPAGRARRRILSCVRGALPTASSSESRLRAGVSSRRGTRRTGDPLGPPGPRRYG
jgi:hypothetical protein